MKKKMDEDTLRSFIERQESRAKNEDTAWEQAKAMDYYLRKPFGNEEPGRSQAISSDVWDVVEGMTPHVLKPFVSSSDVVQFNPEGPEDEEAAKQETDYVNYQVTQKNDAFVQFMAWAKAGLLQKNGVVKYWWDKSRQIKIESYEGLSDDVYTHLVNDQRVTVLEHTEEPDTLMQPQVGQDGQPVPPGNVHSVKIRFADTVGQARYEVVPPEEFLIIGRDPNPQNAEFCQHRTRKTVSQLRELGYDVEDDINDAGSGDVSMDIQAAARRDATYLSTSSDGNGDPSMREVWFRESYCYVDFDGDGIAELRKVCMVGSTVLANDETEEINFAGWTPYQQLFQFDGRCPADETLEVQDIKSTLWRQGLDNIYTINNNRVFAGSKVNLDDLLDNQIAGVVRVESDVVGNQVQSLPVTPLGQIIQPMIEYVDGAKEDRTGFTKYNQGNDADSLNKTATGIRLITQAGNERLALIQRSLAEQGMKTLMLGIHGLCRRHATKAETIRLRGKWVEIDPRGWKTRYDMTVSVGLGTMDKTMELQTQDAIIKMQSGLFPMGIVTPENLYNATAKFVELGGEKNPDKYFTHPEKIPPKQPPDPTQDPEFMLKMAESKQKDRALDQHDRELDQMDVKLGIEGQNAQIDAMIRHNEVAMKNEMHEKAMQAPAPEELQANQQAHDQVMDVAGHNLQAQGQAHGQAMAEQSQELAQKQSEAPEEA